VSNPALDPSEADIDELVAFLPELYADGFKPIKEWREFAPVYHDVVLDFVRVASRECWLDYDYDPGTLGSQLRDREEVARASMARIKSMLTWCIRGERFSSGHWGAMITGGNIRLILERLMELRDR
jgi:hypothetical protein